MDLERTIPKPLAKGVAKRHVSDLRGATRLVTDATLGMTSLVESMHAGIASAPGLPAPPRTSGITGLVYSSVRGVTRLAGGSVDGALALLTRLLGDADKSGLDAPGRQREVLLAALNGVVGDHLAATGNPLAVTMALRHQGRALPLERAALQAELPQVTGRVLVLLHGLCMSDLQWQREGHDHGALLAAAGGYTPVYLRYNSGLPIHVNGASLAALMDTLLHAWPQPLQRVVLLAHSMGGLVARSAMHQALQAGRRWPAQVDDVVFLGTPHHGAPLERAGSVIDVVLGSAPYAAPLARLGRIRSAGISDLRLGHVGADDQPVPLPAGPRWHAVAACLGDGSGRLKQKFVGDGLVPVDSALGRHADPARHLLFDADRQVVFNEMSHMALLSRPEVAEVLTRWLC